VLNKLIQAQAGQFYISHKTAEAVQAKQSITACFIPAVQLWRPYFSDKLSSVCSLNWYKIIRI